MIPQLNFDDFLNTIQHQPTAKKNAEIRLDINRLSPQKNNNKYNKKRKRKRKEFDNQELKEELERNTKQQINNPTINNKNPIKQYRDNDSIRAKTRVHLHKILIHNFNKLNNNNKNNSKKRKLNNNNVNLINQMELYELNDLCNDIEIEIYKISNNEINNKYMNNGRNLLFNLKKNNEIQLKLIKKLLKIKDFVNMNYYQLATDHLIKKREMNKKEKMKKFNEMLNNSNDFNDIWVESGVQCVNCQSFGCKYKPKKGLIESTKSAVFGSTSSKQQMVDMTCSKCHYSFKHEISIN